MPYDGGTTYRTGPRFGPRHIREQSAIIRPYNPVLDLSPFERLRVADYGDLSVNPLSIEDTFESITAGLAPILDAGTVPMCVGGDHSILLPILRAIHAAHGPVGLIQLDAHSDTWDQYWGMKYSHGTPVRRAIEEGLLAEPTSCRSACAVNSMMPTIWTMPVSTRSLMVTAEEFHEHGLPLVREKLKASRGSRPTSVSTSMWWIRRLLREPARPRSEVFPACRS